MRIWRWTGWWRFDWNGRASDRRQDMTAARKRPGNFPGQLSFSVADLE